jgi:hypothetical protein
MGHKATYAIGAVILPDGRLVLSTEGGSKFAYEMIAGLTAETFVSEVIGELNPERALIVEMKDTIGMDLERDPSINKVLESTITVVSTGHYKRDLKFFVYKIENIYTFEIKTKSRSQIMFLSLDQIAKQISDKTLNLSFCAKHMLTYLRTCQSLKSFEGTLS